MKYKIRFDEGYIDSKQKIKDFIFENFTTIKFMDLHKFLLTEMKVIQNRIKDDVKNYRLNAAAWNCGICRNLRDTILSINNLLEGK
jgi:hypothetical protein